MRGLDSLVIQFTAADVNLLVRGLYPSKLPQDSTCCYGCIRCPHGAICYLSVNLGVFAYKQGQEHTFVS